MRDSCAHKPTDNKVTGPCSKDSNVEGGGSSWVQETGTLLWAN